MFEISRIEFEDVVSEAMDQVPQKLLDAMDNVVVLVEDEPAPGQGILLGLYQGVPLTSRYLGEPQWPDRIFIYRGPLMRVSSSREDLVEQITVTVIHEIAHHFGIDDAHLHEWGWG